MLMSFRIKIACIVASLLLLGLVMDLVRRKNLREGYSLLWIGAGLTVLILSVWTQLLNWVSRMLGVAEDNSLLFAGAFFFIAVMLLHVSVELTRLRRETKDLAQALAITELKARKALEGMQVQGGSGGASEGAEQKSPS